MWFDKLIEKDGSVSNELILEELNNCISGLVKQIGHEPRVLDITLANSYSANGLYNVGNNRKCHMDVK